MLNRRFDHRLNNFIAVESGPIRLNIFNEVSDIIKKSNTGYVKDCLPNMND